jgi:hypothetical protein
MKVFEIIMLLCFGFAWPTAIYKSVKSKSVEGKSVLFLYIILLGYLSGIINKVLNDFDYVTYLYAINFLMVLTDLVLFYKNKKRIKVSAL